MQGPRKTEHQAEPTQIKIPFSTRLRNKFRVARGNRLNLSPEAKVRGCRFHVKGSHNRITIEAGAYLRDVLVEVDGVQCELYVGKDVIIGENSYISVRERGTTLTIGQGTMLSRNVKVMTSDGHDVLQDGERSNPAGNIDIGDHVWLADNVTVLKGVTIGHGSIVGINSTLTKSIANNQVAAGNPAKVVRSGITWRHELNY